MINRSSIRILDFPEIINFEKNIQFLSQDERISKVFLSKLINLKQSLNAEQFILTSFGHRDFTPWNIFEKEHHIALIDWELSKHFTPLFYDAFHFIYQQKSLVDNQNFEAILDTIKLSFNNPIVNIEKVDFKVYHQLYILITTVYYLKIYSLEKQWSPQIHKSMNVWNEALSFLLVESKIASQREVLLQDIFSFLKSENYAALKWIIDKPEYLSEESDIDLCINKVSSKKLDKYLSKHPFINSIRYNKKSFMKNAAILLKDNTFLSIDSLWKFKRKSEIMLNENDFLKSAKVNNSGVKVASMEQDILYTWYFYLLNNASVPYKYLRHYAKRLMQQNSEMQMNLKPILRNFKYNKNEKYVIEKKLNLMSENMNMLKVKNIILYAIDTLKDNFFNKGFIITFSGVDGAGKSTVIENMKHQIEKKFRRKVVVLRHRPSILPMLSAWKEGAKVAEQKAAERLPRQGNNNNFFSSLFRFSYYYLDYFFGQFVIYTMYVMRGYIVLYDRYYFDFINDSKRSNIQLPKWLTKGFYFFLLKPKFNFFLYADADIILKRKQELDRNTINNLTQNYLKLFKQLNIKNLTSQYVSIKNEQLPTTIKTINNYIQLEMI